MKRWAAVAAALLMAALAVAGPTAGEGSAGEETASRSIQVLDSSGPRPTPCPDVNPAGEPFVRGGCQAGAYDFDMVLSVRTLFGAVHFGDCIGDFDMRIAADGRFWLDDLSIGGPVPCNDTWPCAPPEVIAMRKRRIEVPPRTEVPPWRGRLTAASGGGFEGSFGFCVDTCLGRYRGDVDVRMERKDGRWTMRAKSQGVGVGSMEVDAEWELRDPSDLLGPAEIDFR